MAINVSEANPFHVLVVGTGNIRSGHQTEEERDQVVKTANAAAQELGLKVRYEAGTYSK